MTVDQLTADANDRIADAIHQASMRAILACSDAHRAWGASQERTFGQLQRHHRARFAKIRHDARAKGVRV